jgi:F0F1-type ATP synthase assembly protein I
MTQQKDNQQDQKQGKELNTYAKFSGIVVQMVAIILVGTYVGVKLDERFPNKNNLYTVGLAFTSVIAAIVFTVMRIIAASKKEE